MTSSARNDRIRRVLARAIEIEHRDAETISDDEVRQIASEVQISPGAIDRALAEAGDELRAEPGPLPSARRRWAPFVVIALAAVLNVMLSPADIAVLAIPYTLALLASGAGAIAVRGYWRRRSEIRIDREGIRTGTQMVKWTDVVRLQASIPGTVTLMSPERSVTLTLKDFGEPTEVMALIRARIS